MAKKIIVTEKPSVARTYARVLGVKTKNEGFFENEEYIVTWCVGHLVTLSYPEKYSEDYKEWCFEALPFLPNEYRYEVIDATKKQFFVIKKLYNRSDIDTIFYAGDSAREGLYIQMLVRKLAGTKKGVTERVVWIDSQTDEEIKRGIKEAKPLSSYENLKDAGYLRAIEDYAVGINLTRAFSLRFSNLYRSTFNGKAFSVGRVQTCVLAMIVDRERERKNFIPTPFYKIEASDKENIFSWKANKETELFPRYEHFLYDENGFKNEDSAKNLIKHFSDTLVIKDISTSKKETKAPLLFNLAELQNECSKKYKIPPTKTLEVIEDLYTNGLLSYPRTDARVLSTAIAKESDIIVNSLEKYFNIKANKSSKDILNSKYVDDDKISDHYAIIPTGKNISKLSNYDDLSNKIYKLIAKRFLSIFMSSAISDVIKINAYEKDTKENFNLSTSSYVDLGYLSLYKDELSDEDKKKITYKKNDEIIVNYSVNKGETRPPSAYTSGSIILAMENAGKLIEDESLREQIKSQGIGTSATRSEILRKLIDGNDIFLNSKTQVLSSTKQGEIKIDIIRSVIPDLTKPELTAEWERKLSLVEKGEISRSEYQKEIDNYVDAQVDAIRYKKISEEVKHMLENETNNNTNVNFTEKKVTSADIETYLSVPFADKDEVKLLGARWDGNKKLWYVPKGKSLKGFEKYIFNETAVKRVRNIYLDVPFDDKDEAKKLGARWDKEKRSWYITNLQDEKLFRKWLIQ